jgi:hypothetical protein
MSYPDMEAEYLTGITAPGLTGSVDCPHNTW